VQRRPGRRRAVAAWRMARSAARLPQRHLRQRHDGRCGHRRGRDLVMGYRTKTPLPSEFGDGSDGDLHLVTTATMTKAIYQFQSLRIDEGMTWHVPTWETAMIPTI